ncbi:hypothetical protein CYD30_27595, partial [Kosakonia cowanii]
LLSDGEKTETGCKVIGNGIYSLIAYPELRLTVITSFQHDFLPGILNLEQPDPELVEYVTLVQHNRQQPLRYALKNSFGMGGSAASLVVAKPHNLQGVSL